MGIQRQIMTAYIITAFEVLLRFVNGTKTDCNSQLIHPTEKKY